VLSIILIFKYIKLVNIFDRKIVMFRYSVAVKEKNQYVLLFMLRLKKFEVTRFFRKVFFEKTFF